MEQQKIFMKVHSSPLFFLCLLAGLFILALPPALCFGRDVSFIWTANPEQVDGYRLYYKTGSSGEPYNGTGATEGPSPVATGNVTTFTLHNLSDTETYYFALTAYLGDVESGYSTEVILPPVSSTDGRTVSFIWTANPEQVDGYRLYYKTGGSGAPYNGTGATEGPSPVATGNVTTFTLHNLSDTETYYFALTAYLEDVESGYSQEIVLPPVGSVNSPPTASDVPLSVIEDVPLSATLPAGDADGDPLTYSIVTAPIKGTAVISNTATGAFNYTPHLNLTGSDSFTFRVNDGSVDSNIATVTITITPVNDIPSAINASVTLNEDSSVNGMLPANDPDGNPLTYAIVTNGTRGSAVVTNPATGAFTYTPNTNANGSDSFTFRVNDGTVYSNTATVTVTINAVNDPPTASGSSISTDENQAVSGQLTANDPDGNPLTYTIVTNGTRGRAVITNPATGTFTYTPNTDATGSDSFTFRVNDGTVYSNTATVTVSIAVVNEPPTATGSAISTDENQAVSGQLTASDPDGDPLTYTIVTNGTRGSAVITNPATGAFTYTPNTDATGPDSFTFRVNDGTVYSNTATVTVSIAVVNQPPTATGSAISTDENQPVSGQLTASDPDGDPLTYTIVTNGTKGSAVFTNPATGAFTYTPNTDATGSDSFTFRVNDGTVYSNTATVTVSIAVVNTAPTATGSSISTDENQPVSSQLTASDPDGDALSYTIVTNGTRGRAVITNPATGAFTYTPNTDATGSDSFTFRVNDGTVYSNTATVTVSIAVVNEPPTATGSAISTDENQPVSGQLTASDPDGDPLTYTIVTNGNLGTAAINNPATGAFTYTPNTDATGSDSFTFRVNDGTVYSNTATVTVSIAVVNSAPTATSSSISTEENQAVSGQLTANDPDGNPLTYTIVTNGTRGRAVITNPATGVFTYTPNTNATGSDSFTFRVNDGTVYSNTATVTVSIALVNEPPTATGSAISTDENQPVSGQLTASDPDGDPLTYAIVTNGTKGSAVITNQATGTFTYTPNTDATGSDSFTFRVNDGTVYSNTATVTVSIAVVNTAPTATGFAISTDENQAVSGQLTASDPDGDPLTYSIVTNGTRGSVVITNPATGAFTYTPNTDATGSDSFTFRVNDGTVYSNTATVTVSIAVVNQPPTATGSALSTDENQPVSGQLTASDPDGDPLTYAIVTNGTRGSAVITNQATGAFTYTPNTDATGSDSFTFRVNDGTVDSNIATVNVTINGENAAPIPSNDFTATEINTPYSGQLHANDPDGDPLTYFIFTSGSKGSVEITNAATGAFTYTPKDNKTGIDSFTFKVNDGTENSSAATVTVNIFGASTVTKVFGDTPDADYPGMLADTFTNVNTDMNADAETLSTYSWSPSIPHKIANTIIMKADLTGIPVDATILEATLALYQTGLNGESVYNNSIHRITGINPVIGQVTGYNAFNGGPWTSVPDGTTYNNIPLGLADIAPPESSITLFTRERYRTWLITSMVQQWVKDPATNLGLLIQGEQTPTETGRSFASSENQNETIRPRLVIRYTMAPILKSIIEIKVKK